MPQPPRPIIRPNAYYHIYNRGVNRRTIFRDDADFQQFLILLRKYMEPVGETLSYALMRDHFHLTVLMKPTGDIPAKLLRTPHTLGRTFSPFLPFTKHIPQVFVCSKKKKVLGVVTFMLLHVNV